MNNLPEEDAKLVRCPQCGNQETLEWAEELECPLCKIEMEADYE